MKRNNVLSVQESARLKAILFNRNINQRQIADELGFTRGYVSGVLNGLFTRDERVIKMIEQLEELNHAS